jgi:hypothetical protein
MTPIERSSVQQLLDPNDLTSPVGNLSVAVLPPAARRFGYLPDVTKCLPGDLILSRGAARGKSLDPIVNAQAAAGFAPEHACWTHAAVFLYDELLVEAIPWHGVVQRSIYVDIPDRILRVRRHPALAEAARLKIALRALSMLGTRYSHLGALQLGLHLLRGLWDRTAFAGDRNMTICSEVFHDAFADITRSILQGCPVDGPVTPAHLSATADLADVEIGWLKLV